MFIFTNKLNETISVRYTEVGIVSVLHIQLSKPNEPCIKVEKLNFLMFHLQSFISIKCLQKFPVVWAAVSPPTNYLLSAYGAKTSKLRRATHPTARPGASRVRCLLSWLPRWTSVTCLGGSNREASSRGTLLRRAEVEQVLTMFSAKPTKSTAELT